VGTAWGDEGASEGSGGGAPVQCLNHVKPGGAKACSRGGVGGRARVVGEGGVVRVPKVEGEVLGRVSSGWRRRRRPCVCERGVNERGPTTKRKAEQKKKK